MIDAAPDSQPVAAFRRLLPIPAVPRAIPHPCADRDEAVLRWSEQAEGEMSIPAAARSRLIEPDGPARATVVLWHGFTNAPPQFAQVAEALAASGLRVLLARMPHHGQADQLTRDLANLTVGELVDHVSSCIDVAVGFGDPVWVVGLSAGATLAAWAAAGRPEVSRLVLLGPLVAPKGLPLSVVRALVRFPRLVPNIYFWWDPRRKANLGHGPYVYPGFPLPGILPFLHLSEAMFDHSMVVSHGLERAVLTNNPGDFAIRRDAALAFARQIFFPRAEVSAVAEIDPSLRWMHDFVDPFTPGTATTEQTTAIIRAALGVGAPDAGGVLVPPLVPAQP